MVHGTATGGAAEIAHSNARDDRWGWDDSVPPRGGQAQPIWHDPTEAAQHVDVQKEGWQWSYLLDEPILHSKRGRPYYRNRKDRQIFMRHTVRGNAYRAPLQLLQAGARMAQSTAKRAAGRPVDRACVFCSCVFCS